MANPFLCVDARFDKDAKKMHRVANKISKRQRQLRKPSPCVVVFKAEPVQVSSVEMVIQKVES